MPVLVKPLNQIKPTHPPYQCLGEFSKFSIVCIAIGFGEPVTVDNGKYGFGLSSYDGFWPSFSKQEAKLLGVQGKIIALMIEYLANSSNEKYSITLVQIQRESVGSEDSNNRHAYVNVKLVSSHGSVYHVKTLCTQRYCQNLRKMLSTSTRTEYGRLELYIMY